MNISNSNSSTRYFFLSSLFSLVNLNSLKNVVKLEHYYSPDELRFRLKEFVDYYNNKRYHESLQNVTPADVYFGRDQQLLKKRNLLKQKTMKKRREIHLLAKSEI